MKKILTLLIAAGAFLGADAQSSKEDARRIILGEDKNKNGTVSQRGRDIILGGGNREQDNRRVYPRSGNTGVEQVNREYDAKIRSIRNNPNLSRSEKERIIRQLEQDRKKKIRQISDHRRSEYGKNKKYKKNPGKHKGWSKGKGNKHRNRHDD